MSPLKHLLIDAICGRGLGGDPSFTRNMEARGLATYTGNQWNESWAWQRSALANLKLDELDSLYADLLEL